MHALVQSAQKAAHNARMMVSQQQTAGSKRKATDDNSSDVETLRARVSELTKEVTMLREQNESLIKKQQQALAELRKPFTMNEQAVISDPYSVGMAGNGYQAF